MPGDALTRAELEAKAGVWGVSVEEIRRMRQVAKKGPTNGGENSVPNRNRVSEPSPNRYFVESFPDFVARVSVQPKPRYIVGELIAERTTALCHRQPRARKTLFAQHVSLCAAIKAVPFALERFAVPEAVPVLYVMGEDGERVTMERFLMQLAGWGYTELPENLFLSVRRGVDLDETEWQEALIEAAKRFGAKLTVFDPLRSLSSAVDQGPAELKPLTSFFRRFIDETGSAILSVHHDVKPPRNQGDDRARPQRASGGGIFSNSDAPVALELAGKKTLVAPTLFKFSEDPAPFTFDVVVTDGTMALVGHNATLAEAADFELSGKLLDYVAEHPGSSTEQVRKGVGRRKDAVKACLEKLVQERKLDTASGKRGADLWFPPGVGASGTGPGTGET